ncbi:MAG TPA: phage portal protein, partial [Gemmata sp.]
TTAGNAGNGPLMVPAATGDDRTTASGMTELDFVPGMVPHLAPGEEVEPFIPSSPGNQYEPFTKAKVRGIGAGVGLSYGQVARQSESNYSAARQDMLEDRKEFEPLQEWLAHKQVLPIYGLFVTLAVMEGRLDGLAEFDADDFALNPERYQQVEYVAPAPPWIDPEKEINAYEKAIKLRVMDRTEVVATTSGRRLEDVWGNIESENADAAEKGIALPEVVDAKLVDADATQKYADAKSKLTPPPVVADGPDPELERMRAEADVYGVAVRAGEVTPQVEDEEAFRQRHGLPPMSEAARAAWAKGGNVRQPITLAPPGADASPGVSNQGEQPVDAPPPTEKGDRGEDDDENDEAATAKEGLHAKSLAELAAAVDRPPNYRLSMVPETRCDGCRHFAVGMCTAYNATVSPDHLCDAFETPPVTDGDGAGTIQPPPLQDGEVPIDNVTAGGFAPDARLAAKAVYDSSSTQVEVPEPLRSTVMELGRQLIPDDLLYRDDSEYGRETEPHVTVLYGLETGDVGPVKAVMADAGRATVTLGRVGVFSREDKPFDVVFAEVHSPDLVKLNKVLSGLPHRNDYPEYHPHMTIAYVDKGHGSRFEGREEFVGLLFTADAITFSSNSGRRTSIPLNPK